MEHTHDQYHSGFYMVGIKMFFKRKTDTINDCLIVDGNISSLIGNQLVKDEIVGNQPSKNEADDVIVSNQPSKNEADDVIVGNQPSKNEPNDEIKGDQSKNDTNCIIQLLPDPCNYMPSYLTHTNYCSDYGLFLDYCTTCMKYSPRYLQETMLNLSFFRKKLTIKKFDLSIESIKEILSTCTAARQNQLIQALKCYANYRDFHGDHRLIVLLARAHIKRPKIIASKKPKEALSSSEFRNYWTIAQSLCTNLDRVGIWIGLCCVGIKSSEIRPLHVQNNQLSVKRRSTVLSVTLPKWLAKAIDSVPAEHWRHSRQNILRGISSYGTTAQKLYNSYKLHHTSVFSNQ